MKRKKGHSGLRLKIAIAVVLAVIWLIAGLFRYVNSPRLQSIIYASVNRVSSLKIQSAKLNLNILKRSVTVSNILLENHEKHQEFSIDKVFFKFRILPLFRGSIKLVDLNINTLRIDIATPQSQKKKRPRIGLANLLFLRNLTIKNGTVNRVSINMPNRSVTSEKIQIDFDPTIWGKIDLALRLSDLELTPQSGNPVLLDEINIRGETDVSKWINLFPYVDDLNGKIDLKHLKWKDLDIESIGSKLSYSKRRIRIDYLNASINGKKIGIDGKVDANSENYSINLDIPEPVYLPPLGNKTTFLNTSGNLAGKISIKGKGLDYKSTEATAEAEVAHTLNLKEPLPAYLKSEFKISGGQISISAATLRVGNNMVDVSGFFNYINPNINLSFDGDNVPVESVMNRFADIHYHPASGIAKVTGRLTGWKPNLKFDLSVESNKASYYDILVERLRMDIEMTYNKLILTGTIFQGELEAGKVKLDMQMGAKLSDGTRHKTFELKASLNNYDLTPSMAEYGLTGIGNGEILLKGINHSYNGSGKASITGGSIKGIGFQNATSNIQFATKKITFSDIAITTSETNPAKFESPIIMDITDYGLRLHGTPRPGLAIDSRHLSANGSWQIDKLIYTSEDGPEWESRLSGSIGVNKELNLKISGIFDTSLLSYLRGYIREAKGPAELKNIHIGGTTENMSISGTIVLDNNELQLKNWGYYLDNISGNIVFRGHAVSAEDLSGRIEYGDFKLKGSLNHQNNSINRVDLSLDGKSVLYATSDRAFRMEFDCGLSFKGNPSSSALFGNINIIDGRYTKNFSIFEQMKKGPSYEKSSPTDVAWKNIKLDVKVRTSGDLKIDNNIGEVWLNADLGITGLRQKPRITGTIETVGGEIHYAGLEFEVARGYVEFRDPYTNPYVEIVGTKEVGDYNVALTVRGQINKLYIDLSSTPPLERKDVMALLTFGVTEAEMQNVRFGYQVGTGLVAEQIGSILQGPVTKFTPLDRFRIESAPARTGAGQATRLHMGKDISDRLKVYFITDVNAEDAQQTFEADYLLTDFLLLKGARLNDNSYRFHLSFRFREQ